MMKTAFGSVIAALAFCVAARCAEARSLPGYGGKAWVGGDDVCFYDHFGSANLQSSCSSATHYWLLPLQIENNGANWTPVAYVYAQSDSASVGCQNWGSSKDMLSTYTSAWNSPGLFARVSPVTPGPVFVPYDGHLFMWCWIQSGASLNNVQW